MEKEWLETLATINPSEVTYTDFCSAGSMLAKELKNKGCDYVIALTHMRTPNDVLLAERVPEIDLILGGHDHVYEKKMVSERMFKNVRKATLYESHTRSQVNGKYIIKSGTDFRQFSVLTVDFSGEKPQVEVEAIEVTSKIEPDNEVATLLEKYKGDKSDLFLDADV